MKCSMFLLTILGVTFLAGCGYYQVTDPNSGRMYYTNNWIAGRYGFSGAVQFFDQKSGQTVTLQSSEVKQISKDEYMAAVGTPAPYTPDPFAR